MQLLKVLSKHEHKGKEKVPANNHDLHLQGQLEKNEHATSITEPPVHLERSDEEPQTLPATGDSLVEVPALERFGLLCVLHDKEYGVTRAEQTDEDHEVGQRPNHPELQSYRREKAQN